MLVYKQKASLVLLIVVTLSSGALFVEIRHNNIIEQDLNGPRLSETEDAATIEESNGFLPPPVTVAADDPQSLPRFVNVSQHPGEDCNRVCVVGDQRICHFDFTLEHYQAVGVACGNCLRGITADCNHPQCVLVDGIERGFMSINRKLPGPAIQVCKDDLVVVDVHNKAQGTAAALHWHGIHMQKTPFMDGVPFLTQCPISFATSFRYSFRATQAGTHFYHSHSGHAKVNGQYGALIVREPPSVINNADSYDHDLSDHYLLISDWMPTYGEQFFPNSGTAPVNSVLINGRGIYTNPQTKDRTFVPPTRYYVQPGKRYRFRIINAITHVCPLEMQIEQHELLVIASDSFNVSPRPYTTIVSNAGERYDFVLTANHTEGDFWIRVRGMGLCTSLFIESFAFLRYVSNGTEGDENKRPLPPMPEFNQEFTPGDYLNHPNASCLHPEGKDCITELSATEEVNILRFSEPDHKFFLGFDNQPIPNDEIFKPGTYGHFANILGNRSVVGNINGLSLTFPPSPPLTQRDDVLESDFCDALNRPQQCDQDRACRCTHRLKIRRNAIVELIIIDTCEVSGRINHPFHLHGHRFLVTGMGLNPLGLPLDVQSAMDLEKCQLLPRVPLDKRPPFKDTVSIPSHGYAVVRFRADNSGYWLLHCHYEWHLSTGMALIMQVGEPHEMEEAPWDFPKCGNYIPKVRNLE